MIVSPDALLNASIRGLGALSERQDLPADVRMQLSVVSGMLAYSRNLDVAAAPLIREGCADAADQLAALARNADADGGKGASGTLEEQARQLAGNGGDTRELLGPFYSFLQGFDAFIEQLAPSASPAQFGAWSAALMDWQVDFNRLAQVPPIADAGEVQKPPMGRDGVQALLRTRLGDDTLVIEEWTPLTGGFGKETIFIRLSGAEPRELVMRRDMAGPVIRGIDCHEVRQEYPLLKGLFDLGFPVPEPLFLETAEGAAGGPDFIIMERVAGKVEGDQFGGEGMVAAPIRLTLAQLVARLHNLPPLLGLDDASRELRSELWGMTAADATRDYMAAWYRLYLSRPHLPIPALHAMYRWLQDNVVETDEPPALVHGDIGLYNLLFHDGELSALLDWEFSHIGDPAEDLGTMYAVMGKNVDWSTLLQEYAAAGRPAPSMHRIRYYVIWGYFRNLCIASTCLAQFASGQLKDLRYGVMATRFVPFYIERISTLIREWEKEPSA